MSSEKTASGGRSASDKSGTSKSAAAQAGGRKSSGAAPKSRPRRTSQRPPIKRRTNVLQAARDRVRATTRRLSDPETWRAAREQLPPWTDEIAAIMLIVLGVVIL